MALRTNQLLKFSRTVGEKLLASAQLQFDLNDNEIFYKERVLI